VPLIKSIRDGLNKTRMGIWQKTVGVITGKRSLSPQELSELEELLILSDVGVEAGERLINAVRNGQSDQTAMERLKGEMLGILSLNSNFKFQISKYENKPQVWLIIGVNGSGKTTSIAKLAHYLKEQDRRGDAGRRGYLPGGRHRAA